MRKHPHLRVHGNERQHREVVVRAEAEAYVVELFHRDDYTIFSMRDEGLILREFEKTSLLYIKTQSAKLTSSSSLRKEKQ